MADTASTTTWIGELKAGNQEAAQHLWERYATRLGRLARGKLRTRRMADEEDVVLAAFDSFLRGVQANRFPRLNDRNDLWQILVVLTGRKAAKQRDHDDAQKRRVLGESVFGGDVSGLTPGIARVVGDEPSPEFCARFAELFERLMGALKDKDERLCQLAALKIEGYQNQEIAERMGCALRTVERKLAFIRKVWTETVDL